MKSDTERGKYYHEEMHKRKNRLHAHLSKNLRSKLKTKKRSILIHKNDVVKVMRGAHTGKEAKVARVSVLRRKIFLEGIAAKTAKGKEVIIPFEVSNLLLVSLEPTEERKKLFSSDAFREKEKKVETKTEAKAEAKSESKTEAKAEAKEAEAKADVKSGHATRHEVKPAEHRNVHADRIR